MAGPVPSAGSCLPALVLSGGRSSRMGSPKALLEVGGRTLLERIAMALAGAGFGPVTVVLGFHPEPIAAEAARLGLAVAHSARPEEGQVESVRAGLRSLGPDASGALVHPVDHPGMRPATLVALRDEVQRDPERIVVTSHAGRRGHPTWFPRRVFAELLDPALEGGARTVLRRDPARVHHLVVDDPGVRVDLDTPEDYRRWIAAMEEVGP